MKLARNTLFLMFAAFIVVSAQRAEARGGFCPEGCWCDGSGSHWDPWVVDCTAVEYCNETYPNFCSDFFSYCYNDQCPPPTYGVWTYGCEDIGACWAQCGCVLNPNKGG